jgi:hypothetical protein
LGVGSRESKVESWEVELGSRSWCEDGMWRCGDTQQGNAIGTSDRGESSPLDSSSCLERCDGNSRLMTRFPSRSSSTTYSKHFFYPYTSLWILILGLFPDRYPLLPTLCYPRLSHDVADLDLDDDHHPRLEI